MATPYQLSDNWKQNKIYVKQEEDQLSFLVVTTWLSLKGKHVDKQLRKILELMKTADNEEINDLISQYNILKEISRDINLQLTRVISF